MKRSKGRKMCLIHFTVKHSLTIILLNQIFYLAEAAPQPDSLIVAVTGKNKSELLESGDFLTLSAFENDEKRSSDESVTAKFESETEDSSSMNMRAEKFIPVSSIVSLTNKTASSIRFLLFTQKNKDVGDLISELRSESFFTSNWNLNEPVKLLVHGYRGDCERDSFSMQLITAYIASKKNYNIVCMDWKNLATEDDYFDAANNTEKAADRLVDFLIYLKRSGYIPNMDIVHVIGYDLGAHAAGQAGQKIQKSGGGMIGRITGLDPSAAFSKESEEKRLDSSDADFVDVIHTNMGSLKQGYLGITMNSGHQDFLPNGGRFQPTCGSSIVGDIISTCSHQESFMLFAKTIREKNAKYVGCKCSDWPSFLKGECGECKKGPMMGEMASKEKGLGSFYLRVEAKN